MLAPSGGRRGGSFTPVCSELVLPEALVLRFGEIASLEAAFREVLLLQSAPVPANESSGRTAPTARRPGPSRSPSELPSAGRPLRCTAFGSASRRAGCLMIVVAVEGLGRGPPMCPLRPSWSARSVRDSATVTHMKWARRLRSGATSPAYQRRTDVRSIRPSGFGDGDNLIGRIVD